MTVRRPLAAALCLLAVAACAPRGGLTIQADFADVGDLVNRANVQQSDTVVGRVTRIELVGWRARVTMVIRPDTKVPRDSVAVVRSTSLLGEKFVDLQRPPGAREAPLLRDGARIPIDRTSKTPEVEQVFDKLGGILASGALADLGTVTSAAARIVEGQEDQIGRVVDGTARLVGSLARQREAIASTLDRFGAAATTFAAGTQTTERFLETTAELGRILAEQRAQLSELIVQLDRLGQPSARLVRAHAKDVDSVVKSLLAVIPQLAAARADMDAALSKLPAFAVFFAASAPGDYVQLDVQTEGQLPLPASANRSSLAAVLWSATRVAW